LKERSIDCNTCHRNILAPTSMDKVIKAAKPEYDSDGLEND